jgi:acyl-CoA thioesterase-2
MIPGVTNWPPSLTDVIDTLQVEQLDDERFVATQLDNPSHHIVGGHIAGQALMAASRTAPGRIPHSVHVYYLRAGDASRPVDVQVEKARDGGTLSTRLITARQDGEILLEALASFTVPGDGFSYQEPMADVPQPETLPSVQEQLAPFADEFGARWAAPNAFDLRYVDPPPRLALQLPVPSPRIRLWWRPTEPVPDDPVLGSCLLTYLTGTMMLETAVVMRRATPQTTFNALIDHALWFHRPVDFADWVLSDQSSPSGVGGRGLATGTLHNRSGELVCIGTQELYFGRK